MQVKKLIEILKNCDGKAEVFFRGRNVELVGRDTAKDGFKSVNLY